jgi:DNA-binding TFAR19-related protein (PDSD5 family)
MYESEITIPIVANIAVVKPDKAEKLEVILIQVS